MEGEVEAVQMVQVAELMDIDKQSNQRCNQDDHPCRNNTISPSKPENSSTAACECSDYWSWNRKDKSHEVRLYGERGEVAHFHPNWSNGTAGVRGQKALNGGIYYWEIRVSQRVFGTSMMFGIGTAKCRLHVEAFVNLLGENDQSMGLSHKGLAWYNGTWKQFTKPFKENESTTIGLLFDGIRGTLTYYKDGVNLGVAFTGLNKFTDNLYPIVSSTAAKTEMMLTNCRRCYTSLQDRCRAQVIKSLNQQEDVEMLPLPKTVQRYIHEEMSRALST